MDPLTIGLIGAAIQSIGQIASQLAGGQITEAQAQEFLKQVAVHYNTSVAAWQAAAPKP